MMFCRAAWQRLAPLARKTLTPLPNNAIVPIRQMSFGIPASGTNIAYVVLCGGSLTAALVYAYKTINSDSARYNERITQIEARTKRAMAEAAVVAEEAVIVETTAAELATIVEAPAAEPVVEVIDAVAEQTPESVDATMEVETAAAIVQAVAVDNEEPTAPVVEEVVPEAVAPVAETTVTPMSELMSTVKILAGSTMEIAAASVGDQHLVAAVRLNEENNAVETLNGFEVDDVKAQVSAEAPDEAVVEEAMIDRSDQKSGELEELPSETEEESTAEEADDHVKSEADSSYVDEIYTESPASSEEASVVEMENILELEESVSPVVMKEDDNISGAAETTLETFEAENQKMDEEKAPCHDAAGSETEPADVTAPAADLEETQQETTEATEDVVVTETMLDVVEEAQPAEASEKVDESQTVSMTMAQA